MVRDIQPGSYSSYPEQLVNAGGLLYFVANDGSHGYELWRSDGTSSGTILLRDIRLGSLSSYISGLREFNGGVVFAADDGVHGKELWKSLGQPGFTFLLSEVAPGSDSSNPSELANLQGKLVFRATDSAGDIEPYILDDTATTILRVIRPSAKLYKLGETLEFRVIFNNSVNVDTSSGTPAIALQIGSRIRLATYVSGTGSNVLIFRYTVRPDDLDLDGIVLQSPIRLRGGTITGPANTPATLTFTPPDATSVRIDGVAPRIVTVQGPRPGIYKFRDRLRFFVLTTEPVYWRQPGGRPYLEVMFGNEIRQAFLLTGSGTNRLVFEYRIERGDNAPSGIWIRQAIFPNGSRLEDAAGNPLYLTFVPPNLRKVRVAT
jgi:ELWxxDGT repeat protein